jgi:hypothetical protein
MAISIRLIVVIARKEELLEELDRRCETAVVPHGTSYESVTSSSPNSDANWVLGAAANPKSASKLRDE